MLYGTKYTLEKFMARKGITYDEVALVADKLVSEGNQPTIQRVREELGTGSPNTIHRHLSSWKETQPQTQRAAVTLPSGLADALVKEIERQASTARADAEEKALEARRSADKLADTGEALEEENEELKLTAELLERERDQSQALADDRQNEIDRLVASVDREQKAAEAARVDLAKAQLVNESHGERIVEQREETRRLVEKMEAETSLKQGAEQRAAVAESKVADMTTQIDSLKLTLKDFELKLRDAETARSNGAVSESKVVYLTEKVSDLENKLSEAEKARYEAMVLVERNQAKLDVTNEKVSGLEGQIKNFKTSEKAK